MQNLLEKVAAKFVRKTQTNEREYRKLLQALEAGKAKVSEDSVIALLDENRKTPKDLEKDFALYRERKGLLERAAAKPEAEAVLGEFARRAAAERQELLDTMAKLEVMQQASRIERARLTDAINAATSAKQKLVSSPPKWIKSEQRKLREAMRKPGEVLKNAEANRQRSGGCGVVFVPTISKEKEAEARKERDEIQGKIVRLGELSETVWPIPGDLD